jgi:hypothetical protein
VLGDFKNETRVGVFYLESVQNLDIHVSCIHSERNPFTYLGNFTFKGNVNDGTDNLGDAAGGGGSRHHRADLAL